MFIDEINANEMNVTETLSLVLIIADMLAALITAAIMLLRVASCSGKNSESIMSNITAVTQ